MNEPIEPSPIPAPGEPVDRLLSLFTELGRVRSFRDPLLGIDENIELSSPQMHAVLWLGVDGPLSMSSLAQRIGSPVPACTGVVDRLEKMNLVERDRDVVDRRVVNVALSDEGRRISVQIQTTIRESLSALLSTLSETDVETLLAVLTRLVGGLAVAPSALSLEPSDPAS